MYEIFIVIALNILLFALFFICPGIADAIKAILGEASREERAILFAQKHYEGNTAFIWAARHGYADIVEALLANASAKERAMLFTQTDSFDGITAFVWAAYDGHTRVIKALLADASTEERTTLLAQMGVDGSTVCVLAGCYKHTDIVELLLADASTEERATLLALMKKDREEIAALRLAQREYAHLKETTDTGIPLTQGFKNNILLNIEDESKKDKKQEIKNR